MHFQHWAGSMALSILCWNTANTSFIIVCIQSPSTIRMMQDQKSLTRGWRSCSGWGKVLVSAVFSYKGGQFIRKGQWCAEDSIVWLTVEYINAAMNRTIWNTEPVIGTEGSCQTQQNQQVDGYRSGFGLHKMVWVGFWDGSEYTLNCVSGPNSDSWQVTLTPC